MHGGDVWEVAQEFDISASDLLDFSANINPRGLPPRARERLVKDACDARLLSFYPDPSADRLRRALSEQLSLPPEAILIGAGAEALLSPILRALQPHRALVPTPAFSEYRRVCEQQEIPVRPFALRASDSFRIPVDSFCQAMEEHAHGLVILNHPHNPTGAMLEPQEVTRIRDAASSSGAALLVDEAFIDYVPDASLATEAALSERLVVLRSLTKFYGCPALRVGYAVSHPDTIRRIAALSPTWPVTQLAIDALAEAVTDREFGEISRCENAEARLELAHALTGLGLMVFPSAANYLFIELPRHMPEASKLRRDLIAKHRILIRNCDSYEGLEHGRYIRVAVRSKEENRRLIDALAEM